LGLGAAAVALLAGALALNRDLVGVFYDDGFYAALARSLARGQGYVQANLPAAPAAIHYPPLYPILLAPLFGTLSLDAAAFAGKLLNLGCAAAAAGLAAWHATRARLLGERAPRWLAAAVVAAAAVAIPVLQTQSVLFAEPLFALLFAVTVALADAPPPGWAPGTGAVLAGVAAALTLLTRTIGVAAGAGIVVFLLVVRGSGWSRAALAAAPVAAAAVGWGLWTLAHRAGIDPALAINYGSYGEVVRQAGVGAFGASAADLPRPLGAITLSWMPSVPLYYLFGAAALAVGAYGLWVLGRSSSVGLSLAGYLAILAVWPFPPDRFLWAVLPWLALAWTTGAVALWRVPFRAPVAVLSVPLVLGFGLYETRGLAGRWWRGDAPLISANFRELLPWLGTLPPEAVLATDDEALVWLYTGRASVPLYLYGYRGRVVVEPGPAEQRAYLDRQGVTHVVLASSGVGSARQLRRLIAAYPGWLTPLHAWPGARWVYAINRGR
jgi:hypothetical protein